MHLITVQGESPSLLGFKPPEAVLKQNLVHSAGWANKKGDPQNKTMYGSLKPQTFPLVGVTTDQIKPNYDTEYRNQPIWGPFIRV